MAVVKFLPEPAPGWLRFPNGPVIICVPTPDGAAVTWRVLIGGAWIDLGGSQSEAWARQLVDWLIAFDELAEPKGYKKRLEAKVKEIQEQAKREAAAQARAAKKAAKPLPPETA